MKILILDMQYVFIGRKMRKVITSRRRRDVYGKKCFRKDNRVTKYFGFFFLVFLSKRFSVREAVMIFTSLPLEDIIFMSNSIFN